MRHFCATRPARADRAPPNRWRHAGRATFATARRVGRVRRLSPLCVRRRLSADRLESVCTRRKVLSQAVCRRRRTNPPSAARHEPLDGLGIAQQAALRQAVAGAFGYIALSNLDRVTLHAFGQEREVRMPAQRSRRGATAPISFPDRPRAGNVSRLRGDLPALCPYRTHTWTAPALLRPDGRTLAGWPPGAGRSPLRDHGGTYPRPAGSFARTGR